VSRDLARFLAAAEIVNRGGMAEMIAAVRATFAEEGLDRLLADRTRLQLRAYRERIRAASDGSLESRVRVLAAIRREQG
jgi:predicted ArsR family transcriptional regulator